MDNITMIPHNSEAGQYLWAAMRHPGTELIRTVPCGDGRVKIKINEGMWTPALSTTE